jgi:hypothetical protein
MGPTVVEVELTGTDVIGTDEVLVHPPLQEVIVTVLVENDVRVMTWVPDVVTEVIGQTVVLVYTVSVVAVVDVTGREEVLVHPPLHEVMVSVSVDVFVTVTT